MTFDVPKHARGDAGRIGVSPAVIFDMDGVLIDSSPAHLKSWQATAARDGLTITQEQFNDFCGVTSRDIIRAVWKRDMSDEEVRALDDAKEETYRRIVQDRFPIMPGAVELIRALHEAGIGVAIGSAGSLENVSQTIDRLAVAPYLDAVVHGGEILRGKPDPEVFLLAAKRMNRMPRDCVVVEDAKGGVAAAKAAGMTCIGFKSAGHTDAEYVRADRVILSLAEIEPRTILELLDCR